MEDEESLKTSALFRQLADSVKNKIYDLLSNGIVATGVVVGSILLSSDELFRVEELTISSHSDFINDGGLKINEDSSGNMFACSSLSKEGVEGVIMSSNSLVRGHLSIGLDSMFKAVEKEGDDIFIYVTNNCVTINCAFFPIF